MAGSSRHVACPGRTRRETNVAASPEVSMSPTTPTSTTKTSAAARARQRVDGCAAAQKVADIWAVTADGYALTPSVVPRDRPRTPRSGVARRAESQSPEWRRAARRSTRDGQDCAVASSDGRDAASARSRNAEITGRTRSIADRSRGTALDIIATPSTTASRHPPADGSRS